MALDELHQHLSSLASHVRAAWLVRKRLPAFDGRQAFLLLLDLPHLDEADGLQLCQHLEHSLQLPGPILIMRAGQALPLADIRRRCGAPVFESAAAA